MQLYNFFRNSAGYRVRIALNLKKLDWEYVSVNLLRDGGEQLRPEYRAINPQQLIPALRDGDAIIPQSLAIIEYLEEKHPEPSLYPADPVERARARAVAQHVACEIHPLANTRVQKYLRSELGIGEDAIMDWCRHWIGHGLAAIEAGLGGTAHATAFCFGDRPSVADLCIVPQFHNARRMGLDLTPYPTLVRIDEVCRALPAFAAAAPERQPDAA